MRRITRAERARGVVRNEDLPWNRRDHALFVAFAPVDKPRYALSVVVEHGGSGSRKAAPIARDIMIEVQRRQSATAAQPFQMRITQPVFGQQRASAVAQRYDGRALTDQFLCTIAGHIAGPGDRAALVAQRFMRALQRAGCKLHHAEAGRLRS